MTWTFMWQYQGLLMYNKPIHHWSLYNSRDGAQSLYNDKMIHKRKTITLHRVKEQLGDAFGDGLDYHKKGLKLTSVTWTLMGWCNGSCHNVACDGQNLHPVDAMAWHHVLPKTYWVMCLHDNYADGLFWWAANYLNNALLRLWTGKVTRMRAGGCGDVILWW